ncbi:hypothetical protein KVP10_08370 [Candidimonas humi]|nr:hypothetical protein [Candidimonas humi]
MHTRNLNWPGGVNRADSNWTGRAPRVSNLGGGFAPDSHRIPKKAWIGGIVFMLIFFGLMPFLGFAAGF